MSSRSFTVIVPTRERCDTLEASLKSVTTQDFDRLKILVSDNFSQDQTREVVQAIADPRVVYVNTGKRLSMSENWEFALSHVSSDWVTIIGDDDALLPKCLDRVSAIADETGVEAIRSTTCSYAWPGRDKVGQGALTVPMRAGVEIRSCREWLHRVLYGKARYPALPMLYNGGFLSMNVIRECKRDNTFYRSCIPDVYSAVIVSNALERYVYSFEPLAINGASRHSTGTAQFSKAAPSGSPAQTFRSEGNLPFHPSVPMTDEEDYPKSLLAMVYESCAQVAEILPSTLVVEPEVQLRTILATAGVNRQAIEPWAQKFALLHHLDFAQVAAAAQRDAKGQYFRRMFTRLQTSGDVEFFGNKHAGRDVYEASLIADAALQSRPLLPLRVARRFTGKLRRLIWKLS